MSMRPVTFPGQSLSVMRQPTIALRRENVSRRPSAPKHAPRASYGRGRTERRRPRRVSDLLLTDPEAGFGNLPRALRKVNRIQCKQALGRFCSRMPRRCTPRNKRCMQCYAICLKSGERDVSGASSRTPLRSPALFCLVPRVLPRPQNARL